MVSSSHVLTELSMHQGRDRGVAAATLARKLGIPVRTLRTLISRLRIQGVPVCGKPATGYFIPLTPAELDESCEFLRNRAMHSLQMLSRMKNIPLQELFGQLRLTETEKP